MISYKSGLIHKVTYKKQVTQQHKQCTENGWRFPIFAVHKTRVMESSCLNNVAAIRHEHLNARLWKCSEFPFTFFSYVCRCQQCRIPIVSLWMLNYSHFFFVVLKYICRQNVLKSSCRMPGMLVRLKPNLEYSEQIIIQFPGI
jgi:hypothetical protein